MAKKHRAGRPHASQRKKAGKQLIARALSKVRKKAKPIGKNARPKAKRKAALAAKGGGNATAAGVTFQASVGAIFAVQMLTESSGDSRLGLLPFKVKALRFESDAPLDDIAVETDQGGWLLLQAKTTLGLSTSLTSEFGKTVLQIARQWHAGLQGSGRRGWDRPLSREKDRLVIAVGPGASQTLTNDLAKALDSLRASASAPLPVKQRTALKQLTTLLKQAWKLVAGKSASEAGTAGILPFISVLRFDAAGADRVAAVAQLRLLTSTAPAANGSFVAAERECQALMERRHGGDVAAFRRALSQAGITLKAAPSYQGDVDSLRKYSARIAGELTTFEVTLLDGKRITIDRAATDAVVRAAKVSSLLVIGDPGSGKSAVVSAAASVLRAAKADVIQFAVDRLPVETADGLRTEIGLTHRLIDILENWPGIEPAYLFIDALDATRGGRGEAVFRSLIKDVMGLPGGRWRVVASIRSFDLRVGEQFRDLFSGAPADDDFKDPAFPAVRHVNVPAWSAAEFSALLAKAPSLATAVTLGGEKLRDLAGVPFNTRLLADLLSTGVPATAFGNIGSQVELLAIYWGRRVTPLGNAADVCLRAAVELMVTTHTLQAERLQVATVAPAALDDLFKANVLVPVIGDRFVGFRHHILFDYAASRLFINPLHIGSTRARLVAQPGLALMLAPALAYALHDLWLNASPDRSEFWAAVVELTGKTPSDPVVRSVAARMASVLPVEPADAAGLARLLGADSSRAEAARAFLQLVGALAVGIEDKIFTNLAPWPKLAADVSAHLDVIAWPLRTLLSQIVGLVTDAPQRSHLGKAARALFAFALDEPRGAALVTVGIELVSDTYETDPAASRVLLRRLFEPERFDAHAHEDMPALARKAKGLFGLDPDFVADVYRVIFSKRITDTSSTSMGNSQILPMTSNKRQDYEHARWQLSQYVPPLLDTNPALAVRLLTIAAEGSVESEHPTDAKELSVDIGGNTVHLLDDGSHIWAHNPDDPHAHADNIASMIVAFKRRLLESPKDTALQLAQITIAKNRLAVLWARMFLAAAKRPDILGALMWPYASSPIFLKSTDTRKDAIDAAAAFYPMLSADDRKYFELSVSAISFEYPNPERSKRRFLATLFRAIGDAQLATPEAKQLLAEALAESVPAGNGRAFSIFTEMSTPDNYWWLRDKDVDVNSPENAALLRLAEALPDRPAPDGKYTQTASEGAGALRALDYALQNLTEPLPSPLVTEHAQSQLLHGCVALSRRKNDLAGKLDLIAVLIGLVEPHLPSPSAGQSTEASDNLRALAAEAALNLSAVDQATAARLVPKIEALVNDRAEKVRCEIADNLGRLWDFDKPALWRLAQQFAKHESSFVVLRHFMQFLVRALHADAKRIEALIVELLPRAREEPETQGDRLIEGIGNLVACLWLRYELPKSREMLDSWMKDLGAHSAELNRAAGTLRDIVIAGYNSKKESDTRLRLNAQRLARELVNISATAMQRVIAMDATSRTEADTAGFQAAARLIDNVGNQFYFSSGAFRANQNEPLSGLVSLESRRAFLDETVDILHRIGDVGSPHTIYYLLDLFGLLRDIDPERVFDLVSHSLLVAGRMHGFQFESLGADRFVDIVGLFLADHREIFNDQDRRQKLIECLDVFVEAGWPKARRLLYRLPELL